MSGVFGLVDDRRSPQIAALLVRMGGRMSHRAWYAIATYCDEGEGVGLGRIGIGILNQEQQPVVSRDGNTVIFLTGELFDSERLATGSLPRRDQAATDAEYVRQMYETHGIEFVRHLAGAFVIAIYDRIQRKVWLVNDRFGLYPLYFAHRDGYLAFAPEVKAVLAVAEREHRLDEVALVQYLRFQQVLGTRTFFQDVQLLPPASILTCETATNSCQIEPYWSFDQIPPQPASLTFEEAAEEATRLMRLAVARRVRGPHRVGIYLSGGLDSRIILAAYPRDLPRPATLTFGLRNCQDHHCAVRVAKQAGATHCFCEFPDGNWVKEYFDLHLALTEGFHSWIHMHGISTLETARGLFDINLTGFAGDQNLGGFGDASVSLSRSPDELAYLTLLFELFNQRYHWPGISEAEERVLYTPHVYSQVAGLAFESLRQELQPYLRFDRERRIDFFGFINLDLRLYHHYVTFTRACLDVRHPYCDYDLVDFLLAIPVAFRKDHRLQIAVLNRLNRSLATIPIDKGDLLPVVHSSVRCCYRSLQIARQRFNRHIYPLFPERFPLHSDYEGWLRGDLRGWAEGILFDRRTLDRGIFNPDYIRSVWAQHQTGHRPWMLGRIAPVMTYEMMLRALYDTQSERSPAAPLWAEWRSEEPVPLHEPG